MLMGDDTQVYIHDSAKEAVSLLEKMLQRSETLCAWMSLCSATVYWECLVLCSTPTTTLDLFHLAYTGQGNA